MGQSPVWIARNAGFEVPEDTSIILVEVGSVGPQEPLTREKLAPVLAVLRAKDAEEGIDLSVQMVAFDGLGHSGAIHSNDADVIARFASRVQAVRIIENAPSALGGIGDIYNAFMPSLTLGCGSYGRNSVSNNVSAVNLLNIKRVGRRNNNLQWFKVPAKTYFEPNAIRYLIDMKNVERVTIVTDATMTKLGFVDKIIDVLNRRPGRVQLQIIDRVAARADRHAACRPAPPRCASSSPTRSSRSAADRRWMPRRSCGCSTRTRTCSSPTCARSSSTCASARSSSRSSASSRSSCASRPRRAPVRR